MKFKLLIIVGLFVNLLSSSLADDKNNDMSFYIGTFDVIDKEGDDQATLFGVEHKNSELFRNTALGKFSPISGGFITGKNSVYLYTGVEGEYNIGSLKIYPSFAPGYYEKGNGKDTDKLLKEIWLKVRSITLNDNFFRTRRINKEKFSVASGNFLTKWEQKLINGFTINRI